MIKLITSLILERCFFQILNIAKCYQLYYNESDLRNDPIILLGAILYCANSMEMSKVSSNFFSKKAINLKKKVLQRLTKLLEK